MRPLQDDLKHIDRGKTQSRTLYETPDDKIHMQEPLAELWGKKEDMRYMTRILSVWMCAHVLRGDKTKGTKGGGIKTRALTPSNFLNIWTLCW
jgi:hypothetical protein